MKLHLQEGPTTITPTEPVATGPALACAAVAFLPPIRRRAGSSRLKRTAYLGGHPHPSFNINMHSTLIEMEKNFSPYICSLAKSPPRTST